jgi:outer membrane protein
MKSEMHPMRKLLLFLLGIPLCAQEPLSLHDAVSLALRENQGIAGAAAAVRASESRAEEARAGMRPKVNYSESFARSNNPVFVFSSLLTQHQFGAENFNIGPLNRPDFLNNFQSQITVDQPLYDAGQTRNAVKAAGLGKDMAGEDRRGAEMQVIAGVVRAYNGAVLAAESLAAAEQAVHSAEADVQRAESRRDAGFATDADVLSIRVHLAAVTEQRINRAADLEVAKAALNDVLGLPLDTPHALTSKLTPAKVPDLKLDGLEKSATDERPEARQTRLALQLAQTQADSARSSLLPQVGFHAGFEADRQRFIDRGGANWTAAVSLRWNLFNGLADKARISETTNWMDRAKAEQQRADSAVRLEVRRAWAGLRAAEERIVVAQAAVAQADESLRITRNRYEAGMANVTDLLHNETAVLDSHTRYLAAVHDQRVAATMLEFAAGRLTAASEVLQ